MAGNGGDDPGRAADAQRYWQAWADAVKTGGGPGGALAPQDWSQAMGWWRSVLGEPRAMVPAVKAVAVAGYRMMVPVHYIHASYVRSHFNSIEIGIQDAPRSNEILFALVMGTGGRVHSRLGGLTKEAVTVHDGQR